MVVAGNIWNEEDGWECGGSYQIVHDWRVRVLHFLSTSLCSQ